MSSRSSSPVQHITGMTANDNTFNDENRIRLVVGPVVDKNPKLLIEEAFEDTISHLVNDPTVSVACELRVVRREQDDGKGPVTGALRKMVMSKNGELDTILFHYFPLANGENAASPDNVDWAKEFGVNPPAYHESSCVAVSMKKRMHCICGISKASLA